MIDRKRRRSRYTVAVVLGRQMKQCKCANIDDDDAHCAQYCCCCTWGLSHFPLHCCYICCTTVTFNLFKFRLWGERYADGDTLWLIWSGVGKKVICITFDYLMRMHSHSHSAWFVSLIRSTSRSPTGRQVGGHCTDLIILLLVLALS